MKKISFVIIIVIIVFLSSKCLKRDNMEGITVYTTVYPIKYLAEELYGYNSVVESVYPKGVDIKTYKIADKKIADYAKESSLFIYNGLSEEGEMAAKFLKYNPNIRIIDVSQGLQTKNYIEELWLLPTNYLMMALNIKNGLKEYIDNQYIHQEIEENYDKIKTDISKIEAELKVISEISKNKVIVTANESLLYLNKYGYEVISLDNKNDKVSETIITRVKKLISNKEISYIFVLDNYKENEIIRDLIANTKIELIKIETVNNLGEENNIKSYIEVFQNNLEAIKKEVEK